MDKLIVTPDGFKTWKLEADFKVNTLIGEIIVPKGKVTDFASTPRLMWVLLPPFGRYTQASVVHDYMYGKKDIYPDRKLCDKIFYELMIEYGTYKWKAKLMYWAVRLFGGWARK